MKTYRILSIDAWAGMERGIWEWNNWHHVGNFPAALIGESSRKILKYFREELGMLNENSAGRVSIEDDGYNIVILEKSNRRPLYAIEYGDESQEEN